MSTARYVLVDDTNPSIGYTGPWFAVNNTQIDTGVYGPPYQNTLHGVTGTGNVNASLFFAFNGSEVLVYGTNLASATQSPPAICECFVDNISIGSFTPSSINANNWILCGPGQFEDGPHLLSLEVNFSALNQQTFWVDQIQYAPSANISLGQSLLRIDSADPAIQYSSGWESFTSFQLAPNIFYNGSITQTGGSSLTYQFSGTSITAVGTTMPGIMASVVATYTVDNKDPIIISVPSTNVTLYNQMLFETPTFPSGTYTLVVTYRGNSSMSGLSFNYFVQQVSQLSPLPPPPSISSSPTTFHRKSIIGGVTGVVLISLLLLSLP